MTLTPKHSELSYAIANSFERALLDGETSRWEELAVASPIISHPNFGIVVWGEINKDGEKEFSVSLRQNFTEESWGEGNELFRALAPLDEAYEALMATTDKVLDHFNRSLEEPREPLHVDYPYGYYSQKVMQPLLDALNAGDFELAAALTPSKYRLCGYEEFTEEHLCEQRGHGWAGQFEDTLVPAGRYPVFARQYSYHERLGHFENQLKDFQGLSIFLAGKCVADSIERPPEAYPFDNTVWQSPYCHAVAHSILENKSSIHLIPPFSAMPVHFMYDGEEHTTYKIVDTSLPERMKQDPMKLRSQNVYIHKTNGLSESARKLYDKYIWEYSMATGRNDASIRQQYLEKLPFYTPESIKELVDRNLLQPCTREGVPYELTVAERLDMFHSGRISFAEQNSYTLKGVYEKLKKEVQQKTPLSSQIASAEVRAEKSPVSGDSKTRNTEPQI